MVTSIMQSSQSITAVSCINEGASAPLLLVCEHASPNIPKRYQSLGVDDEVLSSHVAFDIGAAELAKQLSARLDARLVVGEVSRLVYDCNRPPEAPDAVPEKCEVFEIPGNRNLNPRQLEDRHAQVYLPFESVVRQQLDELGQLATFITIHSFTPIYYGKRRDLDFGFLCSTDERLSLRLLQIMRDRTEYRCAINEPYGPDDGVAHTLDVHANKRGLLNTMIEVNNDLLRSSDDQIAMADLLAPLINEAIRSFAASSFSNAETAKA
ncbi:MAG: N-formylglutamate amidohydrolase [Pseudomonadota bacterium]